MEIQLDFKASVIKDVLCTLYIIENKEAFDKALLSILPYTADKNVEKYLQDILKSKKVNKKKLNFYFHSFYFDDESCEITRCLGIENSKEISFSTIDEYLDKLKSKSEEEILQKIVSFLAYRKEKEKSYALKQYENTYKDKNKILELLKSCNIPSEIKWNIYMIISEPKKYMNEFCEFIEDFLPVFNKYFVRIEPLSERFNGYISDKMKNEGIEYLKLLPNFENIDKFDRIIVSTMSVNYGSVNLDDAEGTLYIYIGMNIEQILDVLKGRSNDEVLLNVLKTISDSSRFNILKALKDKELFGMELAEKLGLSNATISHHIELLMIPNLIAFNKRDGKIFYKLNKEPLRNMVKAIIEEFKL